MPMFGRSMDGVEVPGMAERVESRRKELRLSPGDFAKRAGLTRQALADVRGGKRKQYQDVTINGVARALRWKTDWYERLLVGKSPVVDGKLPPSDDRIDGLEARVDGLEGALVSLRDELRAAIEVLRRGN